MNAQNYRGERERERAREREKLISKVSKQDNWPVNESDLVKKHRTFHSVHKLNRF